jgi:hypothetical protein
MAGLGHAGISSSAASRLPPDEEARFGPIEARETAILEDASTRFPAAVPDPMGPESPKGR